MLDDWDQLRKSPQLYRLLAHYADASGGDRSIWRDRLQAMEGVKARELVSLHGELLAQDWIEQNTGVIEVLIQGAVPRCYRLTGAGLRALRAASAPVSDGEDRRAA